MDATMPAALAPTMHALESHAVWLGPILGVAAGLEALPIVGAVVPVTPALLCLGAAMAAGGAAPSTLLWAVSGAALGNAVSYEFGRRAGPGALRRSSLLARANDLAAAILARRGGAAIVLSRLLSGAAGLAAFAAGMARMSRPAFYVRSLLANLLWVGVMALAGYVGALGWRQLALRTGHVVPGALAGSALICVVAWRRRRRAKVHAAIPDHVASRPGTASS
jgi:membrane protein DedA with SNARE-associated domain